MTISAPAFVQSASHDGGNAASVAVSLGGNATSHNLIVGAAKWEAAADEVCTLADGGLGNTYITIVSKRDPLGNGAGQQAQFFYAKNITGGAYTLTATLPGTRNNTRLLVHEVSGADLATPLFTYGVALLATNNLTDGLKAGPVSPWGPSYMFGTCVITGSQTVLNAGTGWTGRETVGSIIVSEDQQYTTTPTGEDTATWTLPSGTDRYLAFVAAIQAQVSQGQIYAPQPLLGGMI